MRYSFEREPVPLPPVTKVILAMDAIEARHLHDALTKAKTLWPEGYNFLNNRERNLWDETIKQLDKAMNGQ